ncbi:MAG: histidinol phosphate phosphatase domain-containing protein [Candidatus Omnitrophica bacterium]|nr:histidinol phosphate phosphatase domain-containing protein [Candidatus Omnitrophota bacterium]
MYNLHAHSLLSDGVLLPSEVAARYFALGYKVIAITDHVDYSNIESTVKAILDFTQHWPKSSGIKILAGVELTHIPTEQFKPLAKYARTNDIKVIIAHGQTLMEPVVEGTNRAALEADIDILAHPGIISEKDALLAKRRDIFLEITSRQGHALSNRHVVECARKTGAKLILDTDSHTPDDIISPAKLVDAGRKAGLTQKEINEVYQNIGKFLRKKEGKI